MEKKRELTPIEFAKREGLTLDWVYRQCRLGKYPATLRDVGGKKRWGIQDCRPRRRNTVGKINPQAEEQSAI